MQDLTVIENMCKVATLEIIKREAVLTRILEGFPAELGSDYVKGKLSREVDQMLDNRNTHPQADTVVYCKKVITGPLKKRLRSWPPFLGEKS